MSPKGVKFKLHGRALLLNRNVGHLMTNPAIILKDGSEIPEGIMDAFFSTMCALHDFKNRKNSRTGSVYIVILEEIFTIYSFLFNPHLSNISDTNIQSNAKI